MTSSVTVKICYMTFQSGFGLVRGVFFWVFFVPGEMHRGFVWVTEGGVGVEGPRGAGCSREQFKVHSLFACNKNSSVIRYLNPNQQFHIRNLS